MKGVIEWFGKMFFVMFVVIKFVKHVDVVAM